MHRVLIVILTPFMTYSGMKFGSTISPANVPIIFSFYFLHFRIFVNSAFIVILLDNFGNVISSYDVLT